MNLDSVPRVLGGLRGVRVAVVGDLMLDEYVWGDVSRVSPDAPVQVVDIRRRSASIGGAGNVARNVVAAGGEVVPVGVVGADEAAAALRALFEEGRIPSSGLVTVEGRPTTVKTRVLARGQQIVRLDREDRSPLAPPVRRSVLESLAREIRGCSAILVSDYAKDVVDRSLVGEIKGLARSSGRSIPVVVDPKVADFSAYRGCDAITPNRKEAEAAALVSVASEEGLRAATRALRQSAGADIVLVTLGERGMALSLDDGSLEVIAARAREVFDVTGAGDTVLAYFGLALASGATPSEAAHLANVAAGVAVGRVGAVAVTPGEIVAAAGGAGGASSKYADLAQAVSRVEHERSLGRSIVFTNGCFDLLHAGHVHLLERARSLGDYLVVGLNSDVSVRRLKGEGRPVVAQHDRVQVLAALDAVDLVVVFDDDTPIALIRGIRPDVLVKGGDYTVESIVGAPEVLALGGRVETVPLMAGLSTTGLVAALKRSGDGR